MAQDNPDLEALFEQIAAERERQLEAPPAAAAATSAAAAPAQATALADSGDGDPYDILQRVGHLTRNLHDALRELGYAKEIEQAVSTMPDARSRLDYIANLTGTAAERVLELVDTTQAHEEQIGAQARALAQRWEQVFDGKASLEEFRQCAEQTRGYLTSLPGALDHSRSLLTEIMLAQNFHDLTGQVVKRIATVVQGLESQLVKLLLDSTPPERRVAVDPTWLTGPAMQADQRQDVVSNQAQVDDLLASLGF